MMESQGTGDKAGTSQKHEPYIRVKDQSGTEHVHYSLIYEGFPEEFQAKAEKELKETTELRNKGMQRLKEFMKTQNLPPLKDDLLLLACLRGCKYNLKKTESKLKKLMSVRKEVGIRLRNLGLEKFERIVDDMPFGFIHYRDKFGRAIYYTRPDGIDEDRYTTADAALLTLTGQLFLLSFPITSVAGTAYFGECKSDSLYILYSVLREFRSAMGTVLALPLRLSRVEILNENYVTRCFYRIIEPLLSKKIVSRITLHGSDFSKLHEMYDPSILPEDFEGLAGDLSNKVYKEKLVDFARNLIEEFRDDT